MEETKKRIVKQWNYTTRCRCCHERNEKTTTFETTFNGFHEMIRDQIIPKYQRWCDHCQMQTVQDIISYEEEQS